LLPSGFKPLADGEEVSVGEAETWVDSVQQGLARRGRRRGGLPGDAGRRGRLLQTPTPMGPFVGVVLDDTCGNLIRLVSPA
jgi:hypothetical protein